MYIFKSVHRWISRTRLGQVALGCGVPTGDPQVHVDTGGHAAIKCKQETSIAEWTPVDTEFKSVTS